MKNFEELLQKADWKSEKHVPVIEIVEKGKTVKLYAFSYCNIHGLWVNSEELNI